MPSGFGTPAAIVGAMDRGEPSAASGTPTDQAMKAAFSYLKSSKTSLPKYILLQMAVAGGRPRVGLSKFYPAVSRAQLDAALAAITSAITNCVFPLAVPPLDPGFVGVTVDGQLIPRDPGHAQGWDYVMSGKGVEIFGSACTDLKNGAALSVGGHYGCPK